VDTVKGIELTELGAPSHILSEFSESRIHLILRCSTNTQTKRETFNWCSRTGVDDTAAQEDNLHRADEYMYAQASRAVPTIPQFNVLGSNMIQFDDYG
jgi:hypothetical protein